MSILTADGALLTRDGKLLKRSGSGGGIYIPAPASAAVGQIVKIKAVDASGKITQTEAVDLPSGGGEDAWELIKAITIADDAEETNALHISTDENGQPFSLKKAKIFARFPMYKGKSTIPTFSFLSLNNTYLGANAPYCYTSGWEKPGSAIAAQCSIKVDLTVPDFQIETVWRSKQTSFEFFGPKKIDSIAEIGGIQMLIYPGCKFWLYGVRS